MVRQTDEQRKKEREKQDWQDNFNLGYQYCVMINVKVKRLADNDRWADEEKKREGKRAEDKRKKKANRCWNIKHLLMILSPARGTKIEET